MIDLHQTSANVAASAALLAGAAGTGKHYHSLHGSFAWSNNAGSMAHIPVAKQTVLHGAFKNGELTNRELRILGAII